LKEFLTGLQQSWEEVMKSMELAQKVMKKQSDKKRQNPQGLKEKDNM